MSIVSLITSIKKINHFLIHPNLPKWDGCFEFSDYFFFVCIFISPFIEIRRKALHKKSESSAGYFATTAPN